MNNIESVRFVMRSLCVIRWFYEACFLRSLNYIVERQKLYHIETDKLNYTIAKEAPFRKLRWFSVYFLFSYIYLFLISLLKKFKPQGAYKGLLGWLRI